MQIRELGRMFFKKYVANIKKSLIAVEIGIDDNSSLRHLQTPNIIDYIGISSTLKRQGDIVLYEGHPYYYPLFDTTIDLVVTATYFNNADIVQQAFMEALRILKPDGLIFCNLRTDIAADLEKLANERGASPILLEYGRYNNGDYFAVFVKEKNYEYCHPLRMFS